MNVNKIFLCAIAGLLVVGFALKGTNDLFKGERSSLAPDAKVDIEKRVEYNLKKDSNITVSEEDLKNTSRIFSKFELSEEEIKNNAKILKEIEFLGSNVNYTIVGHKSFSRTYGNQGLKNCTVLYIKGPANNNFKLINDCTLVIRLSDDKKKINTIVACTNYMGDLKGCVNLAQKQVRKLEEFSMPKLDIVVSPTELKGAFLYDSGVVLGKLSKLKFTDDDESKIRAKLIKAIEDKGRKDVKITDVQYAVCAEEKKFLVRAYCNYAYNGGSKSDEIEMAFDL